MPKLDKGDIAEIKEFYDGTFGSVREMARRFNVSTEVIRWMVNHNNFKKEQTRRTRNWQKKHPERAREMSRKAGLKYRQTEKGKKADREASKRQYWKNKGQLKINLKKSNMAKKSTQKIKWDWEYFGRRSPKMKRKHGKIKGISIFDSKEKTSDIPTGYCGSIGITTIGNYLEIWTNGRYQFLPKETGIVLCNKLLDFWGVGLEEIDKRITELEKVMSK